MADHQLLICSVTAEGDHLVCACATCGWVSPPAGTGSECGTLWDEHMALAHATVDA